MSEIKKYINIIAKNLNLNIEEAMRAMQIIIFNGATPAQISALIMGLATKGETSEEIIAISHIINRRFKKHIDLSNFSNYFIISSVDRSNHKLINLAISLVIASFGNKTLCFLENQFDYNIDTGDIKSGYSIDLIKKCYEEAKIGIITPKRSFYIPQDIEYINKELSIDNIFDLANILLHRSDSSINQLIKLSSRKHVETFIEILNKSNIEKTWILYNDDRDSLFSIKNNNNIFEIYKTEIRSFTINPKEILDQNILNNYKDIEFDEYNLSSLIRFFNNENDIYKEYIIFNSAICLLMLEKAQDIDSAINLVRENIENGKVRSLVKHLVEITNHI